MNMYLEPLNVKRGGCNDITLNVNRGTAHIM